MTTQTFHRIIHPSATATHDGLLTWGGAILAVGVLAVLAGATLSRPAALVAGSVLAVTGAFLLSCRDVRGRQRIE